MTATDRVERFLRDGGTLNRMNAQVSFGIDNFWRLLWNLAARGIRLEKTVRVTQHNYTHEPIAITEYRIEQ